MKGKKTGGRTKGTPNKVTSWSKKVITELLDEYNSSGLLGKDFLSLEPRDRMVIAERLMQYTVPKMQATAIDINESEGKKTLEQRLIELSKPSGGS